MEIMSADSFRLARYPGTLAGAHLVRPLHHVADLSTTRLLSRLPLFQMICVFGIHHPSAKYQDFAVLLANRFDAIPIFWPGMERQDHVVRKHAASPRI